MCFFVSQFTITSTKIPKIGTHDAFLNCYVESKFELSRFYRLLVISKINPRMSKFANKTNGTTRSREVPIKLTARKKYYHKMCYMKVSTEGKKILESKQVFLF